jgi:tol-pal system protein YbgF
MRILAFISLLLLAHASALAQEKTAAVLRQYDTAVTLQNHGQFNQAAEQWAKFIEEFPQSKFLAQALFHRGECLYHGGKKKEAAEQYAQVVAKFPNADLAGEALYALGVCRDDLHQPDEADHVFDEFLKKYPQDSRSAELTVRRAAILSQGEKYAEAALLYASISKQWPDSPWSNAANMACGKCLFLARNFSEAKKHFERIVAAGGTSSGEAAHWLIRSMIELKQPVEAASMAEKLLTTLGDTPQTSPLKMDFADAMSLAAENRLQAGQWAEAKKLFSDLLQKYPHHTDAKQWRQRLAFILHNEAQKAYDDGDFHAAEKAFDALLALAPDKTLASNAHYARGVARYEQKKFGPAVEDFQALLAVQPAPANKSDALYMLGLCQAAQGKPADAVASFQAIVKDDPQYANIDQVFYQMAWTLAEQDKRQEAADAFAQLAKKNTDSPLAAEALYRVGEAAYASGAFKKAAIAYHDVWQKVGKTELGDKATHKLGWVYFRLEKFPKAQQTFLFERITWPESSLAADATFMEGESWLKQGKPNDALAAYQQVIAKYPQSDKAPLAKRRMAELSK